MNDEHRCHLKCESENEVVHTDKGNVEELSPGWHMDGASSIKGGGSAEESGEE